MEGQLSILESLGSGQYFDSEQILHEVINRCLFILRTADEKLGRNTLLSCVRAFSWNDLTFIFRSTPIRYEIENLQTNINDYDEFCRWAERLHCHLHSFQTGVKQSTFFQTKDALIESYPVVLVAWQDSDMQTDSEVELMRQYYERVYQTGVMAETMFVSLEQHELNQLRLALHILTGFNVGIGKDVALHLRHFCKVIWRSIPPAEGQLPIGSTYRGLLGASYGSVRSFSSMELLLEAIYHEALHQKLFNTLYTHQIFKADLSDCFPEKFACPWSREGVAPLWELDRVLAAFHVYLHLMIFYASLYKEASISVVTPEWRDERLSVSHQKGIVLLNWLETHMTPTLTTEGLQFFETLRKAFLRSIQLHEALVGTSMSEWEEQQGVGNIMEWVPAF